MTGLVVKPIAISFGLDDMGVVQDAGAHGGCERGAAEGLIPLYKWVDCWARIIGPPFS